MQTVRLKARVWKPSGGQEVLEGTVEMNSTTADQLRMLVESLLKEAAVRLSWEAFFYETTGDKMLIAYLSDGNEHEVFHDPSVLTNH